MLRWKSGSGGSTVTSTDTECSIAPLLPVTVTVKLVGTKGGNPALTVNVEVVFSLGDKLTMLGLIAALKPSNPKTDVFKVTVPLKPLVLASWSVSFTDCPAGRVSDEFETDMTKSGDGTTTDIEADLVRVPLDPLTVTV